MTDPSSIAQAYLDTWNEASDEKRGLLLERYWDAQASYVDPLMRGDGRQQIAALVGAVHQRFPEFRFRLLGTPNGHGDYVRLAWALGPGAVDAPIEGSDVVCLRDGKIRSVIGFIDKAPAAA
jgi:hypothetical protein